LDEGAQCAIRFRHVQARRPHAELAQGNGKMRSERHRWHRDLRRTNTNHNTLKHETSKRTY